MDSLIVFPTWRRRQRGPLEPPVRHLMVQGQNRGPKQSGYGGGSLEWFDRYPRGGIFSRGPIQPGSLGAQWPKHKLGMLSRPTPSAGLRFGTRFGSRFGLPFWLPFWPSVLAPFWPRLKGGGRKQNRHSQIGFEVFEAWYLILMCVCVGPSVQKYAIVL